MGKWFSLARCAIILVMLDDFGGPSSGSARKPKRIEPLAPTPQKPLEQLVAEHEARATDHAATDEVSQQATPAPNFSGSASPPESSLAEPSRSHPTPSGAAIPSQSPRKTAFFSRTWPLSHTWTIVAAAVVLLLIGGGSVAAYLAQPRGQGRVYISKRSPKPAPKDTRVPSTLSGLLVDPAVNQRPVTGVMIENSPEARPQSGLDQASVVFEAIAEGGITRFLALFQDTQPAYLGPIRSARPYYVQWCMGFDCALAHAGGSPEALQNIREWGTKDLNDAVGYFTRVSNRYAPHNLYSSLEKLSQYQASRGYGAPTFTGFTRKADKPSTAGDARPAATAIDFAISSGLYNARFDYDRATNTYKRSQGGAPHMAVDANGAQTHISPKVVVALVTSYGVAADKHSQYGVTGTGPAVIFQDGTVAQGSWNKASVAAPLQLLDSAGQPLALNAGQTWLTALAGPERVTYK